ncbi:MAG: ChaN family lipoprotein [Rhodothermaceae bacterium]|nr:ChaN family lipoprotein [Rhodothermaceae bacterium]
MRWLLLLTALLAAATGVQAQDADTTLIDPTGHFAVYTADGTPSNLDAVAAAMANADVVFLGEVHNDPTAHALQRHLLEAAHHAYGDSRPVALSLEMFERDAQLVLDEYLAGLIRERDFLAASRPWSNYATDYRPLVEYAKAHGLPVIAANAPGRYVSRMSREGLAALDALSPSARAFLPPLTVAAPSEAYADKFRAEMEGMGAHGGTNHGMPSVEGMLASQNLRDATMAFSLAEHLARTPGALILHVNGSFHSTSGLGTVEQVAHYAPEARTLVITMQPVDDIHAAPELTGDAFVIQTDTALQPEQ